MRRVEFLGILLFVLLGAHIVQQASLLPYSEKYGPGPGFLPFWLGWCWIGLSLLHCCFNRDSTPADTPFLRGPVLRGSQPYTVSCWGQSLCWASRGS